MSISTCALREEGDPAIIKITASHSGFLSTPSARRATHIIQIVDMLDIISIHALREEGDPGFRLRIFSGTNFYPRPPRGGRLTVKSIAPGRSQFLSTPSARRATGCAGAFPGGGQNFYPRPPRGGRLFHPNKSSGFVSISIHALREEGDLDSDPPEPRPVGISIHALREEGDHRT